MTNEQSIPTVGVTHASPVSQVRHASPLRSYGLFLLLMAPAVVSTALAADPRAVLYDFESGVVDWKGNVWGKVG